LAIALPDTGPDSPTAPPHLVPATIAELGCVDGQNMLMEFRDADMHDDRLPERAATLVRIKPEVIVAHTTPAALPLKPEPTTIPLVRIFVGDAVHPGLVKRLAWSRGHVTGVSS
jgi:putative tryptophan/tyrosine transport system substrate-binding protein